MSDWHTKLDPCLSFMNISPCYKIVDVDVVHTHDITIIFISCYYYALCILETKTLKYKNLTGNSNICILLKIERLPAAVTTHF